MALVCPAGGVVADRRVETRREEHPLDMVGVVTLLQERERHLPRPATGGRQRRLGELGLGPLGGEQPGK